MKEKWKKKKETIQRRNNMKEKFLKKVIVGRK